MAKTQHQKNNSMMFLWMIATLATSQKWKTKNTLAVVFFPGELIFTILPKEFQKQFCHKFPFFKDHNRYKKKRMKKRRPESPQLPPI
jgi:hypothetical protein